MKKSYPFILCIMLFIAAGVISGCADINKKSVLDSPSNIRKQVNIIDDDSSDIKKKVYSIVWDEVENADKYEVSFLYNETIVTEPHFELPSDTSPGTYYIEVIALSDDESYIESKWSEFAIEVKETLQTVYDDAGFRYILLPDGSGYQVDMGKTFPNPPQTIDIKEQMCDLPVKKIPSDAFFYGKDYIDPPLIYPEAYNRITTKVSIPSTIEEIGNFAFALFTEVSEIYIPDSVKTIGKRAFICWEKLKDIHFPDKLKSIERQCFAYCGFEELELPNGLETIEIYAFSGCDKLKKVVIPESVIEIDFRAFSNCSAISEIVFLPKDLQIVADIFGDTKWIEDQPQGPVILGNVLYTYKNYDGTPATFIIPENVELVACNIFSSHANTSKISPKEIIVPDGVRLSQASFRSCVTTERIRLPEDIKEIPRDCFWACKNLLGMEFPQTLEVISEWAFRSCSSLKKLTFPSSLREIGEGAFSYCSGLEEIEFPQGVALSQQAFSNCTSLKKIEFPQGVTVIPRLAFASCASLKEVKLPQNLEVIESRAFYKCALTEITLPVSVKELGEICFGETLETIYYEGTREEWEKVVKQSEITAKVYFKGEKND